MCSSVMPWAVRRYLDRRILHGTLPEQIAQAEQFFKCYMRVGARMEGFHRVDEPDYPLQVLREAVVNAVVHPDYSLSGEAVRLLYYPDRIEVHSPGLLMPGIRLDDLRAGRVPSRPRNPLLVTLLRDLPGNYMERMGTGISYMMGEMAALGRPTPEFVEQNEFLVTFPSAPMAAQQDADRTSRSCSACGGCRAPGDTGGTLGVGSTLRAGAWSHHEQRLSTIDGRVRHDGPGGT